MNEKGETRIEEEKSRLPVDVRGSKTSVLKLPNKVNVLSLLDFDECSTSTPVCVVNANCHNNVGSYICSCKTGFVGDGKTCTGKVVRGNKLVGTVLRSLVSPSTNKCDVPKPFSSQLVSQT